MERVGLLPLFHVAPGTAERSDELSSELTRLGTPYRRGRDLALAGFAKPDGGCV